MPGKSKNPKNAKKAKDAKSARRRCGKAQKTMRDAFAAASERIGACAQGLAADPADVEALHQYRISLRVARSLVKFARPYQPKKTTARLSVQLKQLQDPTSAVRELDMLVKQVGEAVEPTERLTGWRNATNAAVSAQDGIVGACMRAQAAQRDEFLQGFDTEKTRKKVRRVRALLEGMDWGDAARGRGLKAKALRKRVADEQRACELALANVDAADQDAVHTVRKKAKALRYVTRELAGCLPEGSAQTSQDMKAVQDMLGDMLDARVNASLLRSICGVAAEEHAALFDARADAILDGLKA